MQFIKDMALPLPSSLCFDEQSVSSFVDGSASFLLFECVVVTTLPPVSTYDIDYLLRNRFFFSATLSRRY